jgi:hypothetical protein
MEKSANKPQKGLWDSLPTEDIEKKPKVIFEVNITQKVTFVAEPKEYPSRDDPTSVFYVFDVKQDDVDKVISTSAWTLLHELKKISPVAGKTAEITKRLAKGKQFFEVKEIK